MSFQAVPPLLIPAPSDEFCQMYSCGSLAPKLKRKGGCMDCGYQRPQEPWELSDG